MELSNTFRPAIELDASSSANQAFKTQKSMHVEAQTAKYSNRNDCINTTNAQKLKKKKHPRGENLIFSYLRSPIWIFFCDKKLQQRRSFYTICHLLNSCLFVEFQEIQPSGYLLEQSQNTGLVYSLQENKKIPIVHLPHFETIVLKNTTIAFFLKL